MQTGVGRPRPRACLRPSAGPRVADNRAVYSTEGRPTSSDIFLPTGVIDMIGPWRTPYEQAIVHVTEMTAPVTDRFA